jgi:hypothetical protein
MERQPRLSGDWPIGVQSCAPLEPAGETGRAIVSPADELARQILKAAASGLLLQPIDLSIVKAGFAEATADDVHAAVGHAIRSGWLIAREGGWRLTAAGKEIGMRSRAGIRNKRLAGFWSPRGAGALV